MAFPLFTKAGAAEAARRGSRWVRPWLALVRRWPFVALFVIVIVSNAAGSFFNFVYNIKLIVERHLDAAQTRVFWDVAAPAYNLVAYPACLGVTLYLLWPLIRCRHKQRTGQPVSPAELEFCRKRLVSLPFYQVCVNFLGWIPGAVFFPLVICTLGGMHNAEEIWLHFLVSFTVSALLTTAQTFSLLETFLIHVLYPQFFQDARPAEVRGVVRVPFTVRVLLLWGAVAVMPFVTLLAVVWNFRAEQGAELWGWALAVGLVSTASSALIYWLGVWDLLRWLRRHAAATGEIAAENYGHRILDKRPDELGLLTDSFNDMVANLGRSRHWRETLGQIVGPEVRDEILERFPGLGGEVRELTVLFADIRGFTRRSAGAAPERVVALLNRFLTLSVAAVEGKLGMVNKFLGDGFMALFGPRRDRHDHADLAVAAALDLLARLERLNAELAEQGEAPLTIGIGIHSGPALLGCIGAVLSRGDDREVVRKELTAIGATVNLGQRLEQLTKTCGGPILLSGATRVRLKGAVALTDEGSHHVPGLEEPVAVYRVVSG
jgi:adenylate cyclase